MFLEFIVVVLVLLLLHTAEARLFSFHMKWNSHRIFTNNKQHKPKHLKVNKHKHLKVNKLPEKTNRYSEIL